MTPEEWKVIIAFAIVAATGNIYSGLFLMPETKDRDIFAADAPDSPHERPFSASI